MMMTIPYRPGARMLRMWVGTVTIVLGGERVEGRGLPDHVRACTGRLAVAFLLHRHGSARGDRADLVTVHCQQPPLPQTPS